MHTKENSTLENQRKAWYGNSIEARELRFAAGLFFASLAAQQQLPVPELHELDHLGGQMLDLLDYLTRELKLSAATAGEIARHVLPSSLLESEASSMKS